MDVCASTFRSPLVLIIVAVAILISVSAILITVSDESEAATATSGPAGNDIKWEFNQTTGALKLYGNGPMWDFRTGGTYGLPGWRELPVKSVTISEGITTIGTKAFEQSGLTRITLPTTLVEIHEDAFRNSSLTRITLPAGIKTIDPYAFVGTSITAINLPEGIEYIGDCAFLETNISSLTIPSSLTSIGNSCFMNTDITSLRVPSTLKRVPSGAFGSTPISTLVIEEGVEVIEGGAFSGIYISELIIPDSITDLAPGSFSSCQNLMTVKLGSGMKTLRGGVFSGCISLENFTLGENITTLERSLFYGCSSLTQFYITAKVNYLVTEQDSTGNAFSGSSIEEIVVDPENKYYESYEGVLFTKSMGTLVCYPPGRDEGTYSIPESVYAIEDYAFLSRMDSVNIPDSVVSIGKQAIWAKNLVIPDTVSFIDEKGVGAEKLTIGNGIRQIYASMFFGGGIKVLILGANVGIIGEDMKELTSLEEVQISNENKALTSIGGIVYDKNVRNLILVPPAMTGTYMMPNTVEYISPECFCHSKLTHITFSENLKAIGGAAFKGNLNIKSVKIPSKVMSIGAEAFSDCTNLEMVYFETSVKPSMGYHTFYLGDMHKWGHLRVYSTLQDGFLDRYAGKYTKVEYYDSEGGAPSLLEETLNNPFYIVIIVIIGSAALVVAERYISKRRQQ